ncbi:hypothetical protein PCANC_13155 [Puccinia coronata f. sp. avenae]|uniref:Uncharacterized protein n=1 Tax=Puccinia coronata f. sp. avenae TaxID=200324 RepID=A0A2N5UW87_9BASI|nr:hypothetical protein PCANC_13155 [Puccinia coronata f. sp. avenae]
MHCDTLQFLCHSTPPSSLPSSLPVKIDSTAVLDTKPFMSAVPLISIATPSQSESEEQPRSSSLSFAGLQLGDSTVHASSSPSPKFMTLIPSGERPVVSILRRVHPYGEARFPRPSAAEVTGKATVTSNDSQAESSNAPARFAQGKDTIVVFGCNPEGIASPSAKSTSQTPTENHARLSGKGKTADLSGEHPQGVSPIPEALSHDNPVAAGKINNTLGEFAPDADSSKIKTNANKEYIVPNSQDKIFAHPASKPKTESTTQPLNKKEQIVAYVSSKSEPKTSGAASPARAMQPNESQSVATSSTHILKSPNSTTDKPKRPRHQNILKEKEANLTASPAQTNLRFAAIGVLAYASLALHRQQMGASVCRQLSLQTVKVVAEMNQCFVLQDHHWVVLELQMVEVYGDVAIFPEHEGNSQPVVHQLNRPLCMADRQHLDNLRLGRQSEDTYSHSVGAVDGISGTFQVNHVEALISPKLVGPLSDVTTEIAWATRSFYLHCEIDSNFLFRRQP